MALIQCPECTKDISDKVKACPHCGYPLNDENINEEMSPQQVELMSVNLKASKKTKKLIFISIVVFVVLCISFVLFNWYNTIKEEQLYIQSYNEYIDNLQVAQLLMLTGGSDAEALCNLTGQVWANAIYEDSDLSTDKYTRPNGYFVGDFNTALSNLYSDSSTINTISQIEANQESVQLVIKELQSPPEKLENCYETITELYSAYNSLTDLAINPTGNLTGFLDSKSSSINEFMDEYDKLTTQLPDKIEE